MLKKLTFILFLSVLFCACAENPVYEDTNKIKKRRITTSVLGVEDAFFWRGGSEVIYVEKLNSYVYLVKTVKKNGANSERIYTGDIIQNLVVSPGEELIAFYNNKPMQTGAVKTIKIIDASGKIVSEFWDDSFVSAYPAAFFPEGTGIIFNAALKENPLKQSIYYYDIEQNNFTKLLDGTSAAGVSTDGLKILFMYSGENSEPQMFSMNINGTGHLQLTENLNSVIPAEYSRHGKILFSAIPDSGEGKSYRQVFTISENGKNLTRITTSESDKKPAGISHNGRYILYSSYQNGGDPSEGEVHLYDLENKDIRETASLGFYGVALAMSPDRYNRILYKSNELGVSNLYIYDYGPDPVR